MFEGLCREILDSIETSVFIINKHFEIQFYNKSFKKTFNPKADGIMLIGNSLNCATLLSNEKCGQGSLCENCILRKLLKDAVLYNKKVNKHKFEKKILSGTTVKNYHIKLSIISLDKELYCCLMDDITEIFETTDFNMSKEIGKDYERAKLMQSNMLPPSSTLEPLADFTYFYRQNYHVGGDLFDLYKFDETKYGGYIADVSGSGISGGMITVFLHENFSTEELSPAKSLENFSVKFNELKFSEESYITMFCFAVDTVKKEISVCNAGHSIPAIIKRKDKTELIYLRGKTISNWYEGINYSDKVLKYEKGDKLILMTDGIPDMKNNKGKEYSFDRIKKIITKTNAPIYQMLKKIEIDFIKFSDGKLLKNQDDISILLIQL